MKKIFLTALLLTCLIGCKEEEVISNTENEDVVEVSASKLDNKNVLNFRNFDELEKTIHQFIEKDKDLMEESIMNLKETGRVSLLLAYNFEEDEARKYGLKKENIAKVNSDDQVLLYLLNSEGEIVVNETTYKIDENFVYVLKRNNREIFQKFLAEFKEGKIKTKDRKLLEYSEDLQVYKHGNSRESIHNVQQRTEYGSFFNDTSVRVKARQFDDYWFFYSSIGAITKTEQFRRVWFWSSWVNVITSNRLRFSVAYERFHFWSTNVPLGGNTMRDDINRRTYAINKVYEFCVGPPALYVYRARLGFTQHEAGWYGNNSQRLTLGY